ncbi:MAG: CvpA family protein [Roseiflexaceae bacterium]
MSIFDFVSVIVLLLAMLIGAMQGIVRPLVTAVISYISLVLAGLYFQKVGDMFHLYSNVSLLESHILVFIGMFVGFWFILLAMGMYTFRFFDAQSGEAFFSRSIGMLINLLVMIIVWGIFSHLLLLSQTITIESGINSFLLTDTLQQMINDSSLIRPLALNTAPQIVKWIDVFVYSDIYELFPMSTQ